MDAIFSGPWGPVLIFALRIFDVSLSTVRILLAVRGQRLIVPILGFMEVTIWIFAVGNAIRHLDSPLHVLGYALGFAAGTTIGMWLEERLAFGTSTMHVITRMSDLDLAAMLRSQGCGVTEFVGQGREGPVQIVYTVLPRKRLAHMINEVERADPSAFIAVEDSRKIRRGWMQGVPRLRVPIAPDRTWQRRARAQVPDRDDRSN